MGTDFISIEDFALKWRWLERKHYPLAPNDLSRIRPLASHRAQEFWTRSLTLANGPDGTIPNSELFDVPATCAGAHEHENTQSWIRSLIPDSDRDVVVSWQREWAVVTDIELFVDHWESFCYPSSDDTSVWPESESWILQYSHDDTLRFATRRLSS